MTIAGCRFCGYDVPPIVSRSETGVYLGETCQRCGWHPRRWEPAVFPQAHPDLTDERLRLSIYEDKLRDIASREWKDEGGRIAASIARDGLESGRTL